MNTAPNIKQLALIEKRVAESPQTVIEAIAKRNKDMLENCPDPERRDIHKLLALQAHTLNEFSVHYFQKAEMSEKNKQFFMDYAMKLMEASQMTFKILLSQTDFDPKI